MTKILFFPFSALAGVLAGQIASRTFHALWGKVDDESGETPRPDHAWVSWPKLAAALAIEGAVSKLVRGLADKGARTAFARSTGTWPGAETPAEA